MPTTWKAQIKSLEDIVKKKMDSQEERLGKKHLYHSNQETVCKHGQSLFNLCQLFDHSSLYAHQPAKDFTHKDNTT